MPVLVMAPTLGDLLKYELNGNYSREVVTLKGGTNCPLGAVLGRITASGIHRLSPAATVIGDEGAETAVAVLIEAVDATAGDRNGLVVARGPAIVSKAARAGGAARRDRGPQPCGWLRRGSARCPPASRGRATTALRSRRASCISASAPSTARIRR
jgi:hypothetical protein